MGEVYRAKDTRLDRTVAIKILPTHLSDNPEFKQRFEREARTVSSLNHAHICHLYDVGSQDGTDYLVMEFLDGDTLTDRLRRGPLPFPELLKIGPNDFWPVWSPDGKQIAYGVTENGEISIRRRSLDGSQPEQVLYQNDAYIAGSPVDWSPDGKYLSLDLETKDGVFSNWILPLTGDRKPFRPAATSQMTVSEYDGRFSYDGRWLAYFSYESGRPEVYVVAFASGAKTRVSTTGGWNNIFSRNNELFFVTMGDRLMAAHTVAQPSFRVTSIEPLFQLDLPNFVGISYDVSPDSKQFVIQTTDHTKSTSITLLTDWPAELKK
jgi:hypothetical protein